VLNGDEGSYLIPVKPDTGYAEAALVEPWTCVVASYRIHSRKTFKPGGVLLIVSAQDGDYSIDGGLCACGAPSKIILAGVSEAIKSRNMQLRRVQRRSCGDRQLIGRARKGPGAGAHRRQGLDDVVILGTPDPELAEALGANLAKSAVMAIFGERADQPAAQDRRWPGSL